MRLNLKICTPAVAAFLLIAGIYVTCGSVWAQSADIDSLFEELKSPDEENRSDAEAEIVRAWEKSGSDSMDLLLERGKQAASAGDLSKAIEHLTALTDHAPDFAEGWNARATVFFQMQEYGLAIHDIQKVLALEPRHFGALAGLGLIYQQLEQQKDALRAYRAALAVLPYSPELLEAVKRLEDATKGTLL